MINQNDVLLATTPAIPGLYFRFYEGEKDLPGMLATLLATNTADNEERTETLEDITRYYQHLTNCEPGKDLLIAEVDGEIVAYSRVTWWMEESSGALIYLSLGFIRPEWRRKGLGRAMLRHNQQRLYQIAAGHEPQRKKYFEVFASNFMPGAQALYAQEGFEPVRWGFSMVRPDLENIPELSLPEGLEVRPVQPEHYRAIWDASQEAFRDHWGYVEPSETDYQAWLQGKEFQPQLWQVAWDGEQVAGMILNFVNHEENKTYNRLRGYTEAISVRRPWRRRGLARALLARSLRMHRDLGMTEAALGVDSQNLSGANVLYESMGFRMVKKHITYRKPIT